MEEKVFKELLKGVKEKPIGKVYRLHKKALLKETIETAATLVKEGFTREKFTKEIKPQLPNYFKKKDILYLYEITRGYLRGKKKGWEFIIGLPQDVSLATPSWIAFHRAKKLKNVVDLTLGIGLQGIAFGKTSRVIGIERNKERALIAALNFDINDVEGKIINEDCTTSKIVNKLKSWEHFFLDPSRPLKKDADLSIMEPNITTILKLYEGKIAIELPPLTPLNEIRKYFHDSQIIEIEYFIDEFRTNRITIYYNNENDNENENLKVRVKEIPITIATKNNLYRFKLEEQQEEQKDKNNETENKEKEKSGKCIEKEIKYIEKGKDGSYIYRIHVGLIKNNLIKIILPKLNPQLILPFASRDLWIFCRKKLNIDYIEGPFVIEDIMRFNDALSREEIKREIKMRIREYIDNNYKIIVRGDINKSHLLSICSSLINEMKTKTNEKNEKNKAREKEGKGTARKTIFLTTCCNGTNNLLSKKKDCYLFVLKKY